LRSEIDQAQNKTIEGEAEILNLKSELMKKQERHEGALVGTQEQLLEQRNHNKKQTHIIKDLES